MTDEQLYKLAPHLAVQVASLTDDPNYVKCPRCWHYTHEGLHNYDNLCDRCCVTLITAFPDHESVPHIIANRAEQQAKW